jgi:hypothetical protein
MQSFKSLNPTLNPHRENQTMNQKSNRNFVLRFGLFALSFCLAGGAPSVQANSLAGPSAIVQISFAGGGKRDFISSPFVRAAEVTGTISAGNTSNNITLVDSQSATYVNDRFKPGTATQDNKFILEVLDGRYIGLVAYITGNTGNTLTISQATLPTDGGLAGSKYAIRKDWTLESLFGPASASSPFKAGSSGANADAINIYNQVTQGYNSYYIRLSSGTYSWRDAIGQLANHVRVPYGQGVQVLRRDPGNGSITLSGEVRTARLRRDVLNNKFALFANLSPAATTLEGLNISIPRSSSTAGSVVRVWSTAGAGSWTPYYRRTSVGRFNNAAGLDASTVVVGPGKVVQVLNKGGDQIGSSAITADPRLP